MLSKFNIKKIQPNTTPKPRHTNSINRMNEPEESKANDLRAYISDIEDLENEEGAEFDEDELEINAEQTTGFGAWNPVECVP